jgi:hypothetical protein
VVQMAKSQHNGLEYAIKFFVSRAAFNAELSLYDHGGDTQGSGLAQFLPEVRLFLLLLDVMPIKPSSKACLRC